MPLDPLRSSSGTLGRRGFLKLGGLAAAGAAVSACSPVYASLARQMQPATVWPAGASPVFQALQRLTFGPAGQERSRAESIGLGAWVEEQLAPEGLDDTAANLLVRTLDSLSLDAADLAAWERDDVVGELRRGTLLRQIYSRRQLFEVMTEFWTDHFNILIDKGDCWFLKTIDDRQVVRAHALGNFRDLLWASAHSPAMLVYLDNQANLREAPNENYAREVMELHTLGVHGGYGQADVMELSRCLTGWSVKDRFWKGQFVFRPDIHDDGSKEVIGVRVEPAGQAEAERMLDVFALHPSTANHLARKLVGRFVTEDVDGRPETVERVASAFVESRGDILSTLRSLVLDRGWEESLEPRFKRPLNFVLSALRILEAETDAGESLQDRLAAMGHLPFAWATPDGPSDVAGPWKGGLMARWQFGFDLMTDRVAGTRIPLGRWLEVFGATSPAEAVDAFAVLLLGSPPDPETRSALLAAADGLPWPDGGAAVVSGLLASPAFQYR
jgi:uncharacterized protein (DUF1800 family)